MNGIRVVIYWNGEKIGTSPSILQAGVMTNISTTTVRKLLREGGATVGGYSFSKAQEDK